MGRNNAMKTIIIIIILITTAVFFGGCKKKTPVKSEDPVVQISQNNISTEGNQSLDNKNIVNTSIDKWEFTVPEGFKLEENGGPWYEKRYANENGIVLLFGYYEPNGIDNRTLKEIFDEQVNAQAQNFESRYGIGEITKKDINNDNMIITAYYETKDLKVLERSIMKDRIWKQISVEIPVTENENDYEKMLDIIK